ncbi:MAG: xanthine dehydrogenase family protein molybdopterin-binding subunit [Chloroflexi bacterium]|nr:xanthine dehydrogenase family protein molybdopterin-binding subunit [Chloroflexota bacterium]
MGGLSVVGKGVARVDALEKVTGQAKYVMDLKLPNMLHCKVKRSSLAHARLLKVDTSRAERLPGVKAVATAADTPNIRFGFYVKDETMFAYDKVRFIGEPVAAVAAIDEETAEEAIELIKVEYEELPAVYDPLEALSETAPLVHEDIASYQAGFSAVKYRNVCSHTTLKKGDVEEGFRQSDFIFEDTFKTQVVHQCSLETHPVLAEIDGSGKASLWGVSSMMFPARELLSQALGIPMTKIRIQTVHTGGSFGGKVGYIPLGICLLLARKARRPVRLVLTRQEEFIGTNPRHPSIITLKTGVTSDGRLVSREARIVMDSGACAVDGPAVMTNTATSAPGPYNIPHVKVDARCVYTNKQPFGAFRGYGHPQAYFAVESQMDIIADKLGIDPVEFRLKNCFEKDGSELPTGHRIYHCGLKETLVRASAYISSARPASAENKRWRVGRGVACMLMESGLSGSGAFVKVNDDGTFTVITGTVDVGQGCSTVVCQIAAEELGVDLADISLIAGDTDTGPYDFGSCASRVTRAAGHAVRLAAADVKKQLFELACDRLEANIEDLELRDKKVSVTGSPFKSISVAELATMSIFERSGPILGRGAFLDKGGVPLSERVSGYAKSEGPSLQPATVIAEVTVDTETGRVRVLRCVESQDVGRCINPATMEGQIHGGVVQGIGYALTEETLFENGRILNPSFVDYKMATALDTPQIVPLIVEELDPTGPYGAKGAGEAPIVPVAPAIANAIYNAVGVRIKELPITGEKIFMAMKKSQGGKE